MKLQNEFSPTTRALFIDARRCFVNSLLNADALHHIKGRDSNSPLNSCPINNAYSHFEKGGMLSRMSGQLLTKTLVYLLEGGYTLTVKDTEFFEKYRKEYDLKMIKAHFPNFTNLYKSDKL